MTFTTKEKKAMETFLDDIYEDYDLGYVRGDTEAIKQRDAWSLLSQLVSSIKPKEPTYYACIKGWKNLDISSSRYWTVEIDSFGVTPEEKLIVDAKHEKPYRVNHMTKEEWAVYGVTEDNADFYEH